METCYVCQQAKSDTRPIAGRGGIGWKWQHHVCADCLATVNAAVLQGPDGYQGDGLMFRTEFAAPWFTEELRHFVREYAMKVAGPTKLGKFLFKAVLASQAKLPKSQRKPTLSVQSKWVAVWDGQASWALYRNGEWFRDAESSYNLDSYNGRLQIWTIYLALKSQGYLG